MPRQKAETPPRTREAAAAEAAAAEPEAAAGEGDDELAETPESQTLSAVSLMLAPAAPCRTCSSFILSSGAKVVRATAQEAAPAARCRR